MTHEERLHKLTGLHEIPVLDLLDAVLDAISGIKPRKREAIVLSFGKALKEAVKLRKEQANGEIGSNDSNSSGGSVWGLWGDSRPDEPGENEGDSQEAPVSVPSFYSRILDLSSWRSNRS
jgi:hypothetical protein